VVSSDSGDDILVSWT